MCSSDTLLHLILMVVLEENAFIPDLPMSRLRRREVEHAAHFTKEENGGVGPHISCAACCGPSGLLSGYCRADCAFTVSVSHALQDGLRPPAS